MTKNIELAKKISADLGKNWLKELEEINIHGIFSPIYSLEHSIVTLNTITCYIIYAYDNDSNWLNIKQDRIYNKTQILSSLSDDLSVDIYKKVVNNQNGTVNDVIADYLESQTTWKWRHIMSQLDYYTNTMRFVNQKTEEEKTIEKLDKEGGIQSFTEAYDIDTIAKVNKLKGELLKSAQDARQDADNLLSEIRKEFIALDHAVQGDFGFQITDEKKLDASKWRVFIREIYPKWKEQKKLTKK